jgi:hypothetical protein
MAQTANAPRQNRTITVDFQDESTYAQLIHDGKAFIECTRSQGPLLWPVASASGMIHHLP